MEIFSQLSINRHENLLFIQHRESGLKGVLAIHDTTLGPAVGGIRCWDYDSEQAMVKDALLLSEQASLSAALYGCDAGGGKAVIWCSPDAKTETMLRALGIFIDTLRGRFIASTDLGTSHRDMEVISKETRYVTGLSGDAQRGDYSAVTARGVLQAMKAAAKSVFGSASLKGRSIAVQGLGKVGTALIDLLVAEGAKLFVSDLYFERVKAAKAKLLDATMVPPGEIAFQQVDIFAPCATGGIFSTANVCNLRCKVIAGAASNQLDEPGAADALQHAGILYIPDFLVNAGDVIMANAEIYGIPSDTCRATVEKVYGLVETLIQQAKAAKETPYQIARRWAMERMKSTTTLKKLFRPRQQGKES